MKGEISEQKAKWSGSINAEKRQAKKQRIQDAFSDPVEVEVIPAYADLHAGETKILRVAAYCRVSTDQEAQASSYELQIQYYTDNITRNPEWELAGIYADEGISATNVTKRVEFQRMIADCYAGKIDLVITKDIRRFARNTLDCISYVRQLRNLDPPVAVYFEDEHLNTLDRRNEAFIALLSSVAQGESENKSEAIKWSIKRRFSNGLPLCPTWALLGYTTDEFGNMIIVPAEAETVAFIYESYLGGWTTGEIASKLTTAGTPTVKGLEAWPTGSVYNILRNEKYCGDVLMQKTITPDCLTHRTVKNRGQERQYRLRDHHPAIVSREDWLTVQEMLSDRRHIRKRVRSENPISCLHINTIKGGSFKGFVVFDPAWNSKDIPVVLEKIKFKPYKGVNKNA
jgi:DNA invertase Pin-like site-specific DNA recombinase